MADAVRRQHPEPGGAIRPRDGRRDRDRGRRTPCRRVGDLGDRWRDFWLARPGPRPGAGGWGPVWVRDRTHVGVRKGDGRPCRGRPGSAHLADIRRRRDLSHRRQRGPHRHRPNRGDRGCRRRSVERLHLPISDRRSPDTVAVRRLPHQGRLADYFTGSSARIDVALEPDAMAGAGAFAGLEKSPHGEPLGGTEGPTELNGRITWRCGS